MPDGDGEAVVLGLSWFLPWFIGCWVIAEQANLAGMMHMIFKKHPASRVFLSSHMFPNTF